MKAVVGRLCFVKRAMVEQKCGITGTAPSTFRMDQVSFVSSVSLSHCPPAP